jgi:hypothetical protein
MKKEKRILYTLAAIKFILPFLLQNSYYSLQRDEFLYLAEGHHMAWGYMEVPPLLSVFAWITNLFGDGMFWVKFWPSLFGALTYIIVGKIILSFNGKWLALTLGFLPFIFGAYLRIHFLFQPNFLEVFFWTMIAFSLLRFIQTQQNKWLYIFGICCGLGMLSKYSVAFFIISVLFALLISRHRKVFLNKHFYFSGIVAIVIFLPNLLWQIHYGFPVITHMEELNQFQLQYVQPSGFLSDQILMNLPCVFIWIAGLYFVIFRERTYQIFAWAYVAVIVLLLYFQGKSYYALGAYPILFAFGAIQLERFATLHSKVWTFAFIAIPVVAGAFMIPLLLPVWKPQKLAQFYQRTQMEKTGLLKWEDLKSHPLPQDFADMLGWKEMAAKTAKAYASLTEDEKNNTIIFADNYGQAGAISYYANKYQLPKPYSANASFLYWMPDSLRIHNIILITDDKNELERPFLKNFTTVILSDSITDKYAREYGSLILILKGANDKMNEMFSQKIKLAKEKFRH